MRTSKAVPVLLRRAPQGVGILVFTHPLAGVQIVKGTVEAGESVNQAAHIGLGYRVYFSRRVEVVYLLLVGGDKSSQKRDIKRAIEMARALDKE